MSAARAPLVSVVTPFYNSADTLERCIRSVREQTFGDFEYVLLDNRSTDDSGRIAAEHARQDARIRYLRCEEHLPKVRNYNRALRSIGATTHYCKVVQADDFIYPPCLEQMVALAVRAPSIGVVGACRMAGDELDPPAAAQLKSVESGREICRQYLSGRVYPFGSPTSVMYRADLIRGGRPEFFDERYYFDDVEAILDLLRRSDFGFCPAVLTYTQRDPNSTFGKVMTYSPELLLRYTLLQTHGQDFFSSQELRSVLDESAAAYYEFLIRTLKRPDRIELLKFHRAVLERVGLKWEPLRLCRAAGRVLSSWARYHASIAGSRH